MAESLSVFGLSVEASFPLPGATAAAPHPGAHPIALELCPAAQLERAWSGAAATRPWRGRLGDGEELSIERGRGGDLLFRYGERASFRLDSGLAVLECAPSEPDATGWRRVLLTRVLPNVGIAAGYEALHASAVGSDRGVVAIAAASGAGKSTLALQLIKRGWPLFADDTVVLGRVNAAIEAHPAGPFMNLPATLAEPPALAEDLGLPGSERWVAVAASARSPSPLAAIVILERGPGKLLGAWPLASTPLALAPFMLGLPDDEGREAARFSLYADLIQTTSLLRLTADLRHRPSDLAATLERALDLAPRALAGGVA